MKPATLILLFVALNAVDAVTTAFLVTHRAVGEANPVMAVVLSSGVGAFIAFKVSAAAVLAAVLARFTLWSLKAVCVAFVGIVAWQTTLCAMI